MEKRKMNTRYMATLAMFCGVLLVMGVTGIGFIPLPVIKATTMHIPVILGAVLLGPGAGAVLGGVFGLCSTICHTILVMGSIYVLLAQQYAQAKNVAITAVFGLVMGTVTASGIPEAIIAAILVTVIGKALLHLSERMKKR